jgi:hypothetical protein
MKEKPALFENSSSKKNPQYKHFSKHLAHTYVHE